MTAAAAGPRRAARRQRWLEFKRPIPRRAALMLGIAIWIIFFVLWELASTLAWVNPLFMPPPQKVLAGLYTLIVEQNFVVDIGISILRILASFLVACLIAIPLGILMGSFKRIEAFVNPLVSAWRYLPAPSFIPLLLGASRLGPSGLRRPAGSDSRDVRRPEA